MSQDFIRICEEQFFKTTHIVEPPRAEYRIGAGEVFHLVICNVHTVGPPTLVLDQVGSIVYTNTYFQQILSVCPSPVFHCEIGTVQLSLCVERDSILLQTNDNFLCSASFVRQLCLGPQGVCKAHSKLVYRTKLWKTCLPSSKTQRKCSGSQDLPGRKGTCPSQECLRYNGGKNSKKGENIGTKMCLDCAGEFVHFLQGCRTRGFVPS